jgi:hypothetical protein
MPFELGNWNQMGWNELGEEKNWHAWADSLPRVTREDIARIPLRPGESNYFWCMRGKGKTDAYAKLYCGDFGYYRVWPTYAEPVT